METSIPVTVKVQLPEVSGERDAYRLVIFDETGSDVLLESRSSDCHLPVIEIPKYRRPAYEITTLLRDHRQLSSVLLFSGMLEQDAEAGYFAALQAHEKTSPIPKGAAWFRVDHAIDQFLQGAERRVLDCSYAKATGKNSSVCEPFARLNWITDLQDWVKTVIGPLGLEVRGFQQLNGSEGFSLIRFATTLRPVWFKAVGKPNLHEFPVTMALAKLFPEHLPLVLASRPTYHGWLMDDAGDTALCETQNSDDWKHAAQALADLQIESVGKASELLQAGCRELGLTTLVELVDPFLEVMHGLMQRQTKIPPPVLSQKELTHLGMIVKHALACLKSLAVPETLGHSDFNPGNILVSANRCTFIDWAEAHVGHPFFTFEYLLSHLRKDCPMLARFEDVVRRAYAQRWESVLSASSISEAFVLSPLVSVYAYAVAGDIWRNPDMLSNPRVAGYLRSLTRRMKREADLLQAQGVECLN
jgi:hypothetical protein